MWGPSLGQFCERLVNLFFHFGSSFGLSFGDDRVELSAWRLLCVLLFRILVCNLAFGSFALGCVAWVLVHHCSLDIRNLDLNLISFASYIAFRMCRFGSVVCDLLIDIIRSISFAVEPSLFPNDLGQFVC